MQYNTNTSKSRHCHTHYISNPSFSLGDQSVSVA